MNKTALNEKYDVSDSELRELKRALSKFYSTLRLNGRKNMPTLDELRQLEEAYSEKLKYEADRKASAAAHAQKGKLHKFVTNPEYVSEPSSYDLDAAMRKLSKAVEAENELAYLCRAHGFAIADVIKDFIPTESYSEALADAYRAYTHCKSRPLFRAVPK